jgi:hypothetical protein
MFYGFFFLKKKKLCDLLVFLGIFLEVFFLSFSFFFDFFFFLKKKQKKTKNYMIIMQKMNKNIFKTPKK